MKINEIMKNAGSKISKITGKASLKIKKNSPEILLTTGIVGIGITVVTACKSTLNAEDVLDHHREKMNKIKLAKEYQDDECQYPEEVARKDIVITYVQTGAEFIKLYAVPITIGTLSLACILVSNRIIKKRYLAAVAAYNAISMTFSEYRERVKERFGNDVDYEMRYGVKHDQIEEDVVNEKGKIVKKKEDVEVIEGGPSGYSRYWGKYIKDGVLNPNWDTSYDFNMMFLKGMENKANMILHSRGYIFLNEVYDMLGFDHSREGQLVGWFDDEFGIGDGYVDFGLYSLNNQEKRRSMNGEEGQFLLDFNVDGVIWDKL